MHFRVSSPQVKFPCHLGIDTPSKNELISSTHELEEIRREIGADSLAFISLEGMIKALEECADASTRCCHADDPAFDNASENISQCRDKSGCNDECLTCEESFSGETGFCTGCFNGRYPV